MDRNDFPVSLNLSTPRLDIEVLIWAWNCRLFISPGELEKAKSQKLNWFASYLFPEAEEGVLKGTMKFFLWLFLVDDLLDSENQDSSQEFLNQLLNPKTGSSCGRFDVFLEVLPEIKVWWESLGGEKWQKAWKENWEHYLDGLRWEFQNKKNGIRPNLSDYRLFRPYFSGVFLAIHLLRLPDLVESCESNLLEGKIARLICLCNDLSSAEKEKQVGDFNNELLLMIVEHRISPIQAKTYLVTEIKNLSKDIKLLTQLSEKSSLSCTDWTRRLNLLLGGCLFWASQDTNRYQSTLNGHTIKL